MGKALPDVGASHSPPEMLSPPVSDKMLP